MNFLLIHFSSLTAASKNRMASPMVILFCAANTLRALCVDGLIMIVIGLFFSGIVMLLDHVWGDNHKNGLAVSWEKYFNLIMGKLTERTWMKPRLNHAVTNNSAMCSSVETIGRSKFYFCSNWQQSFFHHILLLPRRTGPVCRLEICDFVASSQKGREMLATSTVTTSGTITFPEGNIVGVGIPGTGVSNVVNVATAARNLKMIVVIANHCNSVFGIHGTFSFSAAFVIHFLLLFWFVFSQSLILYYYRIMNYVKNFLQQNKKIFEVPQCATATT